MPTDATVLDHLIEGRDALVREIQRLTTAKDELDSVIQRLGSGAALSMTRAVPVTAETAAAGRQAATVSANKTGRPRQAVKRTPRRSASRPAGDGSKSIRVHVLEMLGAEERDFGLAEIIDRIHEAGIQAHDDAVRSITIKLMKDGTVERVGRGQYRLARGHAESPGAAPDAPDASSGSALVDPSPASVEPSGAAPAPAQPSPAQFTEAPVPSPPLNLAQPWTAQG